MSSLVVRASVGSAPVALEDLEIIGHELDELRQRISESRGASDAAYIRRVIRVQRTLELSSRIVLLTSGFRPAWILGTVGFTLAKILDNMEIGHKPTMTSRPNWSSWLQPLSTDTR